MAMTYEQSSSYGQHMRDGDWHMNKAAEYERQHYYSDAKSHYYGAMVEYGKAYDIAHAANDYAENSALSNYRSAESSFRSMGQKSYDYYK